MTTTSPDVALTLPLPWQAEAWTQWQQVHRAGRLPHALLLHGAAGLGKLLLARWLAQALLCDRGRDRLEPCGDCASCKLTLAGTHPDLIVVQPEADKQSISVDQVRAACERMAMTSTRSGYRITLIEPAQQMTIAAANSLLKTLEEPGGRSLLMLVTAQASALLPTIRSRCQQVALPTPSTEQALAWLAEVSDQPVSGEVLRQASGAPLRALHYLQSPFVTLRQDMQAGVADLEQGMGDWVQLAQGWADEHLPERLNWLDHWLSGRIRQEILRNAEPITREPRQTQPQVLNINRLFQALDKLRELKGQLKRTALQRELALAAVLMWLQRALASRT